jgi:hypothetical protein
LTLQADGSQEGEHRIARSHVAAMHDEDPVRHGSTTLSNIDRTPLQVTGQIPPWFDEAKTPPARLPTHAAQPITP